MFKWLVHFEIYEIEVFFDITTLPFFNIANVARGLCRKYWMHMGNTKCEQWLLGFKAVWGV